MRYAISDIHGCLDTFKRLLEKLQFSTADTLYLLGDYVDRGPDSKGVIDHIWALQDSGHTVNCLQGNHEEMMFKAMSVQNIKVGWMRHGGPETLRSFGVDRLEDIPQQYWDWMNGLPSYILLPDSILVHAGLNFSLSNPLADEYAMRWARNWRHRIPKNWLDGRIIVHGHTPILTEEIKFQTAHLKTVPSVDIDNGCVYNREGLGQLCAFNLDEREVVFEGRERGGKD